MAVDDTSPACDSLHPALLVQISDSHLCQDAAAVVRGTQVHRSLLSVLRQIRKDGREPDVLVATGDLAHDGTPQAYRYFAAAVAQSAPVIRVIGGNTDHPRHMRGALDQWCDQITDIGKHWRLITLHTPVEGESHGHLSGQQFALIDDAVAQAPDRFIAVALHHNPVVDHDGSDPLMLDNARIFLQHLTAWRQVRLMLWGHTHRPYDCRVDNMRLLAAPATSFQFDVQDGQYTVNDTPPGYRWVKLYDDGSIATGIGRVEA